jgi:alanine dehydrogenase
MGYWAGIVGCYNAFRAVGEKYGTFELKPASQCNSVSDLYAALASVYLPKSYKIVMTGGGKVSQAVIDVFQNIGIEKITPQHFLKYRGLEAVFTQLDPWHYSQQKSGEAFDLDHYFRCPSAFESKFAEYGNNADMLITAHYWPAGGPRLLEPADFASGEFSLQIIADISCDLNGPLPSTLRVSTIESPFYGFHKTDAVEVAPFSENAVTVMAIDNLPAEMPRAASEDLGKSLVDVFFPIFLGSSSVRLIENSIICSNGVLSERFGYLQSWLDS